MITFATLLMVCVDVAVGSRAWKAIRDHNASDAVVHGELRSRLSAVEMGTSAAIAGFIAQGYKKEPS